MEINKLYPQWIKTIIIRGKINKYQEILKKYRENKNMETTIISGKSVITINGVTYYGGSIKITIDDKPVDTPQEKIISIDVKGNIDNLQVNACQSIKVDGNVNSLNTTSGTVYCKDVTGSVDTLSGDIECGEVKGNVQTTSGDVKADIIHGSTKTVSGDIKTNKKVTNIGTNNGGITM